MASKVPEVIFKAFAKEGKIRFTDPEDLYKYCIEHDGEELFVYLKESNKASDKMKMYAFYYVNILQCAVIGFTSVGYEGIDIVKADYLLRASFAKDFIQKPDGSWIPIMLDKRNMSKNRLLKYITDCIFFIENELQITVPSSDEYKVQIKTGQNFKKVRNE